MSKSIGDILIEVLEGYDDGSICPICLLCRARCKCKKDSIDDEHRRLIAQNKKLVDYAVAMGWAQYAAEQ